MSDQKRGKSQQGGLTPSSFQTTGGVHELVARVMRGKCVRQMAKRKSVVLPLPIVSYYHACEHITRKSRADSCTHCLHARIIGLAGVDGASTLTGVTISLLQWEKVARFTATDEVLSYMYYQNKPYLTMFAHRRATKSEPRGSP